MIPGKQYKPEDFLRIAWRYRYLIFVPTLIAGAAAFIYSRSLPNRYRSSALVLIIPPQVPVNYVRPTVTQPLGERLQLYQRRILSRARLERIILELDLYKEERKTLLMDQVVERMRRDISVEVQRVRRRDSPNHFEVSFSSSDPNSAMLVAERLASLFVRENIEGRNTQTDTTISFLQTQVNDQLRQLQDYEARLDALKRANAGRLPGEVEANLQIMQSARQQIQMLTDGIARDRDRQVAIERTIAEEMTYGPVVAGRTGRDGAGAGAANTTVGQQLATARAELAGLRLRLKEDHPDVRILQNRVAELEKRAEEEALKQPVSAGVPAATLTPAEAERQKRLARLRTEFDDLTREIKVKQGRLEAAQAKIADYERRVQAAPAVAAQMDDLMRNYGAVKNSYDALVRKLEDAKLASSIEERQVGEQFQIIDPARRPNRPHSPNRARTNMMGALAGLAFGLAIAALLEYRDTSLRTQEDVLVALSLPVLALVPTMKTSKDVNRARRRRHLMIGVTTAIFLLAALAAVAWKVQLFEGWGR